MRSVVFVVLAVLAASGCVTQKSYDLLKSDYDRTLGDLNGCLTRRGELETEVAGLRVELAELERQRQDTAAKLAGCEKALQAVEDDLAACEKGSKSVAVEKAKLLREFQSLSASADEMRAALAELQKRKEQAEARLAEYRDLLARFKTLIDAGKLKIKIVDGRMVVELPSDVLFDSGSASLGKEGTAAIQEVAKVLTEIPDRRYQVEGHTDNKPIRTQAFPSNWELASARALTVVRAMQGAGLPAERVSAASFGEYKPARANDTDEGRAANRRIEIVVVPDLTGLPGFDELNKFGE
jgi:chemotaxis protein MotB